MVQSGRIARLLVALSILALLAACAAKRLQPNAQARLDVPSKLSLIDQGATVSLVAAKGSKDDATFLKEFAAQLNDAGYFKVNTGGTPAYIMSVDRYVEYRADDAKTAPYNVRYFKQAKQSSDGSGYEVMLKEEKTSANAAMLTTVALYETSTLEPLAYFNLFSEENDWQAIKGKTASNVEFERKLSARIVEEMRRLLVREKKSVGVIFPSGGSKQAKELIVAGRGEEAETLLAGLLPGKPLEALTPEYYAEQKAAGTPRDMNEDLANFYLASLAAEAAGVSEVTIRQAHEGYARILILSDAKDLDDACIHSLARTEENAKRMGVRLIPE